MFVCLCVLFAVFILMIDTFLGWMPTRTVLPLVFSCCSRSNRWHISSCRHGLLCQSAGLCSLLRKPKLCHPSRWPQIKLSTSVSVLCEEGWDALLRLREGAPEMLFVLESIRSHEEMALHFGQSKWWRLPIQWWLQRIYMWFLVLILTYFILRCSFEIYIILHQLPYLCFLIEIH